MRPLTDRRHFSVAFPNVPGRVSHVWGFISHFLASEGCMPSQFEMSQIAGHAENERSERCLKLTANEIAALIDKRRLDGFRVSGGYSETAFDIFLLNAKDIGPQCFVGCRVERKASVPEEWGRLIEDLVGSFASIGGWQWHELYQSWQRLSERGKLYERAFGVVPPGFRTWSEPGPIALTPQPERVFLDTSKNPGRSKELTFRIHFYSTAEMWLGPHFWQYAKCTKEEVLAADFFLEKRDTPHFLYLKCWPQPFTRPDGEQGRMQQRLWKLFFHEDCEWPPGSGSICDEPMYGPPELMP